MIISGAEIVVKTLIEQNIKTIFGYPGGTVIDIYNQLYKHSDEIEHVLAAHEQGAAHAADGYARASGDIGVVLATSGPGATNLVTGIATAYLDSIPLLAITGNVGTSMIGRDSFQEIDITGVTLPITKHNFLVHKVEDLADTIREAIKIAKSGRPGPVLVDIPKDVQQKLTEYSPVAPVELDPLTLASDSDVDAAAELIAASTRPYIYFGGGAVRSAAGPLIEQLAEKIDGVMGASMMGLSEVPDSNPRYLGMQGMHGHYASSIAMAEADLIIAAGVRFSDRATGKTSEFSAGAKKIHVDLDSSEFNKNIAVDLSVDADISDFITKLLAKIEKKDNKAWMVRVDTLKKQEQSYEDPNFLPALAVKAASDITTADTRCVTDVGQHQMWAAQNYQFTDKRTWVSSGGLGTMGFGMGAAIGAAYGSGKRSVLFTGDGSFAMNMNELATAVTYNVPLTIVLLNNGVLGMVRQWQTLFYDKTYSNTVLQRKTDFVKYAEAMGAKGYKATNIEEFKAAFADAYAQEGPTLIDLTIDKDEMVLPMVPAGSTFDKIIVRKE